MNEYSRIIVCWFSVISCDCILFYLGNLVDFIFTTIKLMGSFLRDGLSQLPCSGLYSIILNLISFFLILWLFHTNIYVKGILKPFQDLPVWVVIRLCTDDIKMVDYWNNIDSQVSLHMDVLDDFIGEAKEIYRCCTAFYFAILQNSLLFCTLLYSSALFSTLCTVEYCTPVYLNVLYTCACSYWK